jgi:hypothetical protein
MKRSPSMKRSRRGGHSMMELVIVMSVLAGMATLSWPVISSPLRKSRLHAAGQELSTAFAKARLKAMQSGVPQTFRVQWDSAKYQVLPALLEEATNAAEAEATRLSLSPEVTTQDAERSPLTEVTDFEMQERALADGIVFVLPEERGSSVTPEETLADEGGWSELTVFYPDGSTTSALVLLKGDEDFCVEVSLSSLTGRARIGEIHREESD